MTLLDEIAAAGGRIEARGDRLRLAAPKPLPPDLIARVRDAKPALLAEIAARAEAEAERAAIVRVRRRDPRACGQGVRPARSRPAARRRAAQALAALRR